MRLATMQDLLVELQRDRYSAEKQMVQALPRLAKAATALELQNAFKDHLSETEGHVTRLELVFGELGTPPRSRRCKGIEGLIAEGRELLEGDVNPEVLDAGLIAAVQRIEHYEIAAYATAQAMAARLGFDQVARLLGETLTEEIAADRWLTEIAKGRVNLLLLVEDDDWIEGEAAADDLEATSGRRPDRRRARAHRAGPVP